MKESTQSATVTLAHSPVHHTPLRYPGGKAKLADFVKAVLKCNNMFDGHYVEPYAGGAAIAVELLLQEYVSHIHINDISRPLIAFWKSVLDETDRLLSKIRSTRPTIWQWDKQKKLLKHHEDFDNLQVGFAFLFVNRTARSGIMNGGVIGGREQKGGWLIDARYNSSGLAARIEGIAAKKGRISVSNEDALLFLRRTVPKLPKNALIYLDPPYYVKGKDLYPDYYSHEDHARIASYVTNLRAHKWMLSYDNVKPIRSLYKGCQGIRYQLGYSARDIRVGTEVIYFCDALKIPPLVGLSAARLLN